MTKNQFAPPDVVQICPHFSAIENSLKKMFDYASENSVSKIAIPKIGAGLGGLKWEDVKEIIENIANEYSFIDLFIVENYG